MTTTELASRQSTAEKETFIIAETPEGFRVCSPLNPGKQYVVTGSPESPVCSCPDFQNHAADPEWCCSHILAVVARMGNAASTQEMASGTVTPTSKVEPRRTRSGATGTEQMLIKRSVSPDGRIDSLSVEISCPIGRIPEEVMDQADRALRLQSEIIRGFLQANGKAAPEAKTTESNGAASAKILSVAGMPGKWGGRRLFFNILVNDQVLKYFGNDKQLGEAITQIGFASFSARINEGLNLNLPCRVVTKPSADGKYMNIDRLLPAEGGTPQ